MTELEYCQLTDLQRIRDARKILSEIIPENNELIFKEEHAQLMVTLYGWDKRFDKVIKTK